MHDTQLIARIATLYSVTPATIRAAAKRVASEGLAGRAASQAAKLSLATERTSLVKTNFELLLRLVQQEEPTRTSALAPEHETPIELEKRARRTIAAIAPRLGQTAEMVGSSLEQLATLFEPIGLAETANSARLPHAVALLRLLRQEAARLPTEVDETARDLIEMLVVTADVTLASAERTLAEAREQADGIASLLHRWHTDAPGLSRQLARTDWLMDGWDRVCQLWWLDPRPAARREALREISALLPIIPREVGEWVGDLIDIEPAMRLRRMVIGHEDWRTGRCVFDTIARNEALLAA